MAQDYPNGWKDGWSSADHATQSYSPYAAESAQREALWAREEENRKWSSYQEGLKKQQSYQDKLQAERVREEIRLANIEREAREQSAQRREAIGIIVQQKRDEYNKKSWFGKAIATLRGKSFDKMKGQITEDAERRVDRMSPEQVERFIENQTEKEGRRR